MAWCGLDFTIVRVGPDPKSTEEAQKSKLMCFGQLRKGYSVLLPCDVQRQEFLRTPLTIPCPIAAFREDAVQVAFGEQHWAVLTSDGMLWSAGYNAFGQLGRGMYSDTGFCALGRVRFFETRVSTSVACGRNHTLVVVQYTAARTAGSQEVWGCGSNADHQLSAEVFGTSCNFIALDISNLTGHKHENVVMPGVPVRIAGGSDFSVVSVGDAVGMIGTGYPRVQDSEYGDLYSPVGFKIPADSVAELPWQGAPIKHLVAGGEHVLIGCVCDRRLRVFCWGYPGSGQVVTKPTEVVYDCPLQTSNEFPSMLATTSGNSLIMVSGTVWTLGGELHPLRWPPSVSPSAIDMPTVIDPQSFDHRPVAYVGCGPRHAVFVTTCGRLFVRGHCSWRNQFFPKARDNCLPTGFRSTKQGVTAICEHEPLALPLQVPAELLCNLPCGVVCIALARKLAFLMGTHARLRVKDVAGGFSAGFDTAKLDSLVLKMILDACDAQLPQLLCA